MPSIIKGSDNFDTAVQDDFAKIDYATHIFSKTAPADFVIKAGLKLRVGITSIALTSDVTLSLNTDLDTGTKTAGTGYYVYAKSDSTFYISADKTITADRIIGGFHYGLIPEAEALTGNKTEATKLATWASDCWVVAGQIEADVQAGVRTIPTVDEVIAELPVYV